MMPLQKHPDVSNDRRKELLENAKELRANQTPHENELWYELRANRFADVKFKRQQPIGNYIVDFVALSEKLVIELDGGQHADNVEYDRERDMYLMEQGYRVIRVWNSEWSTNRSGVLDTIYFALFPENNHHPLPPLRGTLPPQGGGDESDDHPLGDDFDDIPFNDTQFAPPPDEDHPPF
jgi:very-short-patch-repair endonuclease